MPTEKLARSLRRSNRTADPPRRVVVMFGFREVRHFRHLREQLALREIGEWGRVRLDGPGDAVFIVHGQDNAVKQEVARFIHRVTDNEPTVLHEQPNRGRTIIEKLEVLSDAVAFAVVLLTGDDDGGLRGSGEARPRGRQNVVLELGLFIGQLGRSRVAVLYEEGVELPSDMSGVLCTVLDVAGAWKLKLACELKAAGVTINADKLLVP